MLASSGVDRRFESYSGQTKNYTVGVYCFSTKAGTLRRNNKDWLALNQDNVLEWGDMSISGLSEWGYMSISGLSEWGDMSISGLSEWGDMSIHGLLFQ